MSDDLSWTKHIEATLNNNFRELTPTVKAASYKTMVRPVLEYAPAVWDPTSQKDITALEQVQRLGHPRPIRNHATC
jgi:hypothetical protein